MNDERLSTDLTESERGEQSGFDAVQLDRLRVVDEELERLKLRSDVVGVLSRWPASAGRREHGFAATHPVAGDECLVDDLGEAVEHPGGSTTFASRVSIGPSTVSNGSRTLRMTGKMLLGDDRHSVAFGTAEMGELHVVDRRLVLVVGVGRRAMDLRAKESGREDAMQTRSRTEATPTSSIVRPHTAKARRSGAMLGSLPASMP